MTKALLVAIFLLVVAVGAFVVGLLCALWNREQIKRDLADRALTPIKIRWQPFAWWVPGNNSQGFVVTYADAFGSQTTTRCSVLNRDVRWVPDNARYLDPDQGWVSRGMYLLVASVLLYFALRWLVSGDLAWHSRYHRIFHVRGVELMLLCASMSSAASSLLVQGFYFGRRARTERACTILSRTLVFLAFAFFVGSMVAAVFTR